MGEVGNAVTMMLDSVVGTVERLCGLPAVATLDWSIRAAQALSVLMAPSRACVMVLTAEPSGRVVSLEASGCGSTLTKADAAKIPVTNWSTAEGSTSDENESVELSIRSRADRLHELGFRLENLAFGDSLTASAARLGGTELWRTAPIGTIWVGSDISDLVIGVVPLNEASPARYLVIQIGLLGHGPNGPRRCSIENHSALKAIMPLLARRATLALSTEGDEENEIPWLTVREQQVIEQIVLGKSVRQIAAELERSPHTVHDHVKSLHRKLRAASRGELIARALGYIEAGTRGSEVKPKEDAYHSESTMSEPKLTITSDDAGDDTEAAPPEVVVRATGIGSPRHEDN